VIFPIIPLNCYNIFNCILLNVATTERGTIVDSKNLYLYALTKNGTIEDYPFGAGVIVMKVAGKMFALLAKREGQERLSLKCDPNYAEILRQQHESITAGYHLNKRHWNTVALDGSIPEQEVRTFIDHSYDLVVKSLTREKRATLIGEK
jgi:predicted DNA-binding protein (MmcQ/YjbR family)